MLNFSLPLLLFSRSNVTSVEEQRADISVFDYLFLWCMFERKGFPLPLVGLESLCHLLEALPGTSIHL